MQIVDRVTEAIPAPAAHAVGLGSGATGLTLWLERAEHLTVFAGAIAAVLAVLGGFFYAVYMGCKGYRAVVAILNGRDPE